MQRGSLGAIMVMMAMGLAACATTPAAGDSTQLSDNSGKICKRMPVMGSNFPRTVCSTAEEWAAFDKATRESVEAFDNDRRQGNTQGSFENQ